ncbi:hypothetical protein RB594_009548 [Gaeumannomyces avenae]
MPAMMDDPYTPTIYRVSGEPPFPDPQNPSLPPTIVPRQVTLRDRQTVATIVPFASQLQVPLTLLQYLSDQFKKEVEGGDTYPMIEPMPFDRFASYWFQNFGGVMLLGSIGSADEVVEGKDWARECLGSFYIKPNYPGRSSHVCNAGFLVTDASRNRGVGRLMGETYLEWAPKLGYTYSVFNLVYETNVASCKIWDGLGFKRIGRVKGCGNLKSYPGQLIDAIMYGRDLVASDADDFVSEERFDKIKFYLKFGKYPSGADRAEKSRLRSAATHYKLLDDDRLMLKGKEVISDPRRQYDISRQVHMLQHGGINRTTATIAEKYHWSRIKETVSDVIRNCTECKELGKTPSAASATAAGASAAAVITGAALSGSVSASHIRNGGSQPASGTSKAHSMASVGTTTTTAAMNVTSIGLGPQKTSMSMMSGKAGAAKNFLATALNEPSSPATSHLPLGSTRAQQQQQQPSDSIHHRRPPADSGGGPPESSSHATHPQHAMSSFTIPSSTMAFTDPSAMTVMSPAEMLHASRGLRMSRQPAAIPGGHNPMLQDQPHSSGLHPHHHHHHHHHHPHHASVADYDQPIDPQIISQPSSHHHLVHHPHDPDPNSDPFSPFDGSHHHHHPDPDPFQALLSHAAVAAAAEEHHHHHHHHHLDHMSHHHHHHHHHHDSDGAHGTPQSPGSSPPDDGDDDKMEDREAVDRDMDMLIEQQDDDEDGGGGHENAGADGVAVGTAARDAGMELDAAAAAATGPEASRSACAPGAVR